MLLLSMASEIHCTVLGLGFLPTEYDLIEQSAIFSLGSCALCAMHYPYALAFHALAEAVATNYSSLVVPSHVRRVCTVLYTANGSIYGGGRTKLLVRACKAGGQE